MESQAVTGWHGSYITKIIRGHAVFGECEIGEYKSETKTEIVDGKKIEYERVWRETTGKFDKKYPVVESITNEQWLRSNAALDARKNDRGVKGDDFANLFQQIAKCAHCPGSMKLISTAKVRRGKERKRYFYYRCANSRRKMCANDYVYDYLMVERHLLIMFHTVVAAYIQSSEPTDDPTKPIREKIAAIDVRLSQTDQRQAHIAKSLEGMGASQEEIANLREALDLIREKPNLLAEKATLERKLDEMRAMHPASDIAKDTLDLISRLKATKGKDRYALRSKINMQMRRFILRVEFHNNGQARLLYGHDGRPLQQVEPSLWLAGTSRKQPAELWFDFTR